MSDDVFINRRAFVCGSLLAATAVRNARAQGFAGLGGESQGFAQVVPGATLEFPRDLGPHPEFRIEWWYLTANLQDASGNRYGAQWTLFRQATTPHANADGWDNRQLWMGHAAVTSANAHHYAERFARGGVEQAGVDFQPFHAWIDSWEMQAANEFSATMISPLKISAVGPDFDFSLQLASSEPLVLQGDAGYSRKSERGQASYYFSQPFFSATGKLTLNNKSVDVHGQAWMDHEWSSQPLASDQTGWDWLSLHLNGGEKVMLFRLRQNDGGNYFAGNWIGVGGQSTLIAPERISMAPTVFTDVDGRQIPTSWTVAVRDKGLRIETAPLNAKSWMGTRYAYWEGPIAFQGSHNGMGYLEMTGY